MGFWLIMVGAFLYREYGTSFQPEATVEPVAFEPRDQWMGIYLNEENRVGYVRIRSDEEMRDSQPGYRLRMNASLETALFGISAGMDINGDAWTAATGDQAEFDVALLASDTKMGVRGTVANDRLTGFLETGGESIPLNFPVDSKMVLGAGMGLPSESMPILALGESSTTEAFDPLAMTMSTATVTCVGEESIPISGEATDTRIYETELGTMKSRAWVDASGEVLQASTPFGFTLRKINPDILAGAVEEGGDTDLIQHLAIIPTGAAISIDADRLVVRVIGVAPEEFPHDPPWQSREGDVLTVLRPTLAEVPGAPEADFDANAFLGADAFVTTTHPDIVKQAHEIVEDENDPWEQSQRLYHWVYESIEKMPVLSVPNALDVLRTRTGDCNEHTVLYTALSRSVGIPTRIAIGLVYSDTLGGFGYHAWPEIHIRGQWYPLDPTLGQIAADASHIKLFNGSIGAWVQLAAFVGQIQLDVIATE